MINLRIVTAKELSIGAAARWREQYSHWKDNDKFADGKTKKQNNDFLNSHDHTPENIEKVMGNKSWSHPECNACGERKDECVAVKESWDDKEILICSQCAKLINFLINGEKKS